MTIRALTVVLASLLLLIGCAGRLVVFDADQKEVAGVPFKTTEVYVKKGVYKKHSKGTACDQETPFIETVSIPTGAQYYATARSAPFAKTAFHIKFSEIGSIAEIGLDSEPAGAENIKAAGELVKILAPSMAGVGVAAAAAPPPSAQACDAGEAEVTFQKLSDYMAQQGKQVKNE